MRIEVKGRNVVVSDELRERIEKRLEKIAKQVSPLAQCDVELAEEKNPSIPESEIAEITLRLKGVTLRAHSSASNMTQAVNEAADDLTRQVKRHRDKRRGRRVSTKAEPAPGAGAEPGMAAP
jgi:putative sigma-54 modulation protein